MIGELIAMGMAELREQAEMIEESHKNKIQAAIDKHINAANLPRKKKKKARKEAQFDYSFFMNLKAYYDKEFGFLC
jgi:hypothetical protein